MFVYLHWKKPGKGQCLDKTRQTDRWTCQNVTKRDESNVKNKEEDKRRKDTENLDDGESGVRWGPWPDHTDTLGSVCPCQLCAVVNTKRTNSHIHILMYACWRWGHTWLICMCVCLSVYSVVTAYPRVLKRVWMLPIMLPVVFVLIPALVPLCSRPWTCMHICVCIRIFTRLLECAGASFHLFFLLSSPSGQDIGV